MSKVRVPMKTLDGAWNIFNFNLVTIPSNALRIYKYEKSREINTV